MVEKMSYRNNGSYKKCPYCGVSAVKPNAMFCYKCGKKFPNSEISISDNYAKKLSCGNCGKEIKKTDKFCIHCGKALKTQKPDVLHHKVTLTVKKEPEEEIPKEFNRMKQKKLENMNNSPLKIKKYCTNCGTKYHTETSKFCIECGQKIPENNDSVPLKEENIEEDYKSLLIKKYEAKSNDILLQSDKKKESSSNRIDIDEKKEPEKDVTSKPFEKFKTIPIQNIDIKDNTKFVKSIIPEIKAFKIEKKELEIKVDPIEEILKEEELREAERLRNLDPVEELLRKEEERKRSVQEDIVDIDPIEKLLDDELKKEKKDEMIIKIPDPKDSDGLIEEIVDNNNNNQIVNQNKLLALEKSNFSENNLEKDSDDISSELLAKIDNYQVIDESELKKESEVIKKPKNLLLD
jgi:predicted amidophosphoribosyltransferase